MAHRETLPNINEHREEEEEEDNEARSPPGPRNGAGQGQGAAGEAVDVQTSGTELDDGDVPGNTLGDNAVRTIRA